ncbi:nitrite reductase small subunit NirD [Kineobactrum salinum]|uniref:Nitrite reductase small subunit NirD n=1 Tax=Kineobactrum salinum TaxID=2708301 RepID=A0A6C0U429_9GAMM|nr:nitrite reductase small subunit NirD [Kineobactrum salinum]QIB65747.1 nitrite reductase small subunit NirD [Kineobactrum salinum]
MDTAVQSRWEQVCTQADLVPNAGVCALIAGTQVAIFFLPDATPQLYALANQDPFSGANVLSRGIVGDLQGSLVVASPVYKQHFDLRSGTCLEDPEVRVPVYAVRLQDDSVLVGRE